MSTSDTSNTDIGICEKCKTQDLRAAGSLEKCFVCKEITCFFHRCCNFDGKHAKPICVDCCEAGEVWVKVGK